MNWKNGPKSSLNNSLDNLMNPIVKPSTPTPSSCMFIFPAKNIFFWKKIILFICFIVYYFIIITITITILFFYFLLYIYFIYLIFFFWKM